MGQFYLVEPFDEQEREWLDELGVAMPPRVKGGGKGRNPTPAEIREVCDALDGFEVQYNCSAKRGYWQAAVEGSKGRQRNRGTLLNIEKWGGSEQRRYKILFEKGDPALILDIVHGLCARCGPLLVTPDSDEPLVVWPQSDLKKLRRAWGLRG